MKKIYTLLSLFAVFSFWFASDANAQKNGSGTVVIQCTDFNVTRPLKELAAENLLVVNPVNIGESKDRKGRKAQKFPLADQYSSIYGNDKSIMQQFMGKSLVTDKAPIANFAGQAATGFRPMDPSGASGPNHYVQMINSTTFRVYSKTGSTLLTSTFGTLWSPATANDGDPIVMYDKAADRWFLSQFGQTGNAMYIAISKTNDPTGAYYTYKFTSPEFPDYLKFSVWADGYYMTSNQAQKVFCFERDAMLAGSPTARSLYTSYAPPQGSGFFVPLPGDASDGSLPTLGTPCPIFSYSDNGWGTGYTDAINIYKMAVTWGTSPTGTITSAGSIATAAFDASYDASWNDISQPGTTQKLDGIGGVLMYRAQFKTWSGYNTVVLNWGVKISSTQRSIMWCELRQNQSTGAWSMYQQGIYAPDASNRWMGSIAMDNSGNIALCYAKSNSSSIYMSLAYAGRLASDPLGTLPIAEVVAKAGSSAQTGVNRDGDYSQTSLDPDGVTFWHTGEYIDAGGAAKTQIYSFKFGSVASTAPTATTSAASSIAANTATLNGSVTANNATTTVTFEYGTTTSYGSTINATPNSVTGSSATAVLANLTGLTANTTYNYRVKAVNSVGTTYGTNQTFTTSVSATAPLATTNAAGSITSSTAILNGSVTANNATTTVTFEYGTSTSYGSTLNATPSSITGATATSVTANLTGLLASTTYNFRVKAVNSVGTTYGANLPQQA